ncbi:MAG: Gfo/Idh/MocA family protein [Candidatus Binatia bacterium]
MSRARPVRIGVLGCGAIACWAHLRILRHLRGATLVAAADPNASARERARQLVSIPVHERSEDVLGRDDLDAVVIGASTHLHAELAVAACAARKHFYLEKPIAASAADARRVVAAAQQAGVTAMMGFNWRFHPLHEQARALIVGDRIGKVRAVQTMFCEPSPPSAIPEWKRRRSTGGGVLLDLASHHVDLLRWFLDDEVREAEARFDSEMSEHDTAWVRLAMRKGTEIQSVFSFRAGLADCLEFIGERGTLRVDRHRSALVLRVGRRLGYGVRTGWLVPRSAVIAWRLRRLIHPSSQPSYRRALAAFIETLRGRPRRLPTLLDGVRSLDAILDAEASARNGERMLVTPHESECVCS